MPKPKNNDLVHFQNFMLEKLGLSVRSSYVYASRVRWILKNLDGDVTAESLAKLIGGTQEHDRSSNYVSAWNRFREFIAEKGVEIPIASTSLLDLKAKRQYLPPEVTHALMEITRLSRMPFKNIPLIRWEHVNIQNQINWEIKDAFDPYSYYPAPMSHTRVVCNWANEREDVEPLRPFVPTQPLDNDPMPLRTLHRFRRAFVRTFQGLTFAELQKAFSDEDRIQSYRRSAF